MNIDKLKELFKFSWGQAFSEDNGKSTVIPLAGSYIILIGGIGFIYGGLTKDSNLISQSVIMVTIGSSILLGRKIINGKPNDLPNVDKVE